MPNGQYVTAALLKTRPATSSIPEEVVLREVHLQNVDVCCKTDARVPRPGNLSSLCHLSSTVAVNKKSLAFNRLLTKVMPHVQPPCLRLHQLIPDLQVSKTC